MRAYAWILFTVGTCSRAYPLVAGGDRLKWLLTTEDGFLMLTIARNIALGRGMSVSAGTIETNGVQPLFAFMQAALSFTVGGGRDATLWLAMVLSTALSVLAFFLARRLFESLVSPHRRDAALLIAAAWYASPISVQNTMNGLETVGATCANLILISAVLPSLRLGGERLSWPGTAIIALCAALAFWMRVDAVLLFGAIGIGVMVHAMARDDFANRWRLPAAAALGALLCAPWCIDSLVRFGHLIPVSGLAQSVQPARALGLQEMLRKLAEYLLVVVPIPERVEAQPAMLFFAAVLVVCALAGALRLARRSGDDRVLIVIILSYAVLLVAAYSASSYAHHFFSRYLYPVSPWLALLVGLGAFGLLDRQRWARIPMYLGVTLVVLVGNLHLHSKVDNNNYRQFVEWIDANVPQEAWVGAPQSGTIGYYHDRTINLDGKVDPQAYDALVEGRLDGYILDSRHQGAVIEYLVGWTEMSAWVEDLGLDAHFGVVVDDPSRNLLVYQRRSAP